MKHFLILFFLFTNHLTTNAQISGKISNSTSKEAIEFVTVHKLKSTIGTFTDENGHFEINATIGDTLVISHIGYQKDSITIRSSKKLNILLAQKEEHIEEVSVTAKVGKQKGKKSSRICNCTGFSNKIGQWINLENDSNFKLKGIQLFIDEGFKKAPILISFQNGQTEKDGLAIPYSFVTSSESYRSWVNIDFGQEFHFSKPIFLVVQQISSPQFEFHRKNNQRECYGVCLGLTKRKGKNSKSFFVNNNEKDWVQFEMMSDYQLMIKTY